MAFRLKGIQSALSGKLLMKPRLLLIKIKALSFGQGMKPECTWPITYNKQLNR